MDSGRKLLSAALRAAQPRWQVVDTPRALDTVRKPGCAVIWSSTRTRLEVQNLTWMKETIVLWVLTATDQPSGLEDDLDNLLMAALEVVEENPALSWSEASRGTLDEKYEGWRLEIQCLYRVTT